MNWTLLIHTTIIFFVIQDAPGTLPLFISLLKRYDARRQAFIILREMLIALITMILFFFFGQKILHIIGVDKTSLQISGGVILFLLALNMIFSSPHLSAKQADQNLPEPFIVPLAIPTIAGPGILATISLYSAVPGQKLLVFVAILISWGLSVPFLLLGTPLKRLMGDRGLIALERIAGFIVILIATDMFLSGIIGSFKAFSLQASS